MNLSLGSPDRPAGRTTYRAAGMTRATSSARSQRAARRLTKLPQRKGNFKPNSGVRSSPEIPERARDGETGLRTGESASAPPGEPVDLAAMGEHVDLAGGVRSEGSDLTGPSRPLAMVDYPPMVPAKAADPSGAVV